MKTLSVYLSVLVKALWKTTAILLVSMAVFISVLRYSLPHMDEQKHHLEGWLSEKYGAELDIGYISAAWRGAGPAIVLKNLEISTGPEAPIKLAVEETQIELDFWSSVLAWQVKSKRFNLSGLDLLLDLPKLSELDESDIPIVDAIQGLFLEQLQRFSVDEGRVVLKTEYDQQVIEINQLSWMNEDVRHQAIGQMRVQELARNSMHFSLNLLGDKDNLEGTFYANGAGLDLSPLIQQVISTDKELTSSRLNFDLWVAIENSKFKSVQAEIDKSVFSWKTNPEVNLAIAQGRINAKPMADGWHFNIRELIFDTGKERPLVVDLAGISRFGKDFRLSAGNIDVSTLTPLFSVILDEQQTQILNTVSPNAQISGFQLYKDHSGVSAQLNFEQLQTNQWDIIPGTKNVNGALSWSNGQGLLHVDARDGSLLASNLLEHDVEYRDFSTSIYIDTRDELQITVPEFQLNSKELNIKQALAYSGKNNWLTLISDIDVEDVVAAKRFFPPELMGRDTQEYLNEALISGQIQQASLLWHGDVNKFPYSENEGIFQASVELNDAVFEFDPSWPALTELSMSLLFENDGLWMHSNEGQLMSVAVADVKAVIPVIEDNAILTVDAFTVADAKDVTDLMVQSDLADSVGATLQQIILEGDVETKLALHIPLNEDEVVARGAVTFQGNGVSIPSLDMELAELVGSLDFENDVVSAQGLSAQLFGEDVQFSLSGKDTNQGYVSDVKLSGHWKSKPIFDQFLPAIGSYVDGIADWRGHLSLTVPDEGFSYSLQLHSDLPQIASTLPGPFQKQRGDKQRFLFDIEGDQLVSSVRVLLGNDIKFNGLLPHNEMQFSRAHLSIGDTPFVGMGTGFSIAVDLPSMEFEPWYESISALLESLPESDTPLLDSPQRIFLKTDSLEIVGQHFDSVELNAKPLDESWSVALNAEQTRANMIFHQDWTQKGVELDVDYLHIKDWMQQEDTEPMSAELATLPPIRFSCKQCKIEKYDLGEVDFSLSKAPAGMKIDSLRMTKPDSYVLASGDWFITENGSSTRLTGDFKSEDFGALLKEYQFNSGIRDSDANMDFDLSWQNAPHEFNFETLNGGLNWRLSDGYLTEVSDGGARIFSILSLESLVRKLRLDFRDVFTKGFFYDKMNGTFQVNNGLVDTKDIVIDGAAAEITLKGQTNLNDNTLDYIVEVVPNVTSSLPFIVGWLANPVLSIPALLLDEVLTSAKVISNLQYSVTGTIDKPVLTELGRKSKEVQLPAKNNNKEVQKPTSYSPALELPVHMGSHG